MENGRTSRKQLLITLAGAGAAVAGGAAVVDRATARTPAASSSEDYPVPGAIYPDPEEEWGDPYRKALVGTLRAVHGRRVELTTTHGIREFAVAPEASVYTDSAASLNDFFPSELVVVEGDHDASGAYAATAIWSAVTTFAATVTRVDGNTVDTDRGRIVVSGRTRFQDEGGSNPREARAEFTAGMRILAEVRTAEGRLPLASVIKVLRSAR